MPVTRNFVGILSALKRRVFRRENNIFVEIILTENSPVLIRDLLIVLNRICGQVSSTGRKSGEINVFIDKKVQFDEFEEIASCFHLAPLDVDVHFSWIEGSQDDNLKSIQNYRDGKKNTVDGLEIFFDNLPMPVQNADYLIACKRNLLVVPLSLQVWARNILKGYPPACFIVCVHLPEIKAAGNVSALEPWRVFFTNAWKDFPSLHFIVLNFSAEWDEGILNSLPNVTFTKMLGYSLLEEFALVRLSDMYIGAYDKYAAAVIGTNKPFMLFGLGGADKSQTSDDMKSGKNELSLNNRQTWIFDCHSPDEFYAKFRHFYLDINGKI